MDTTLSKEIQAAIDAVALSQQKAALVTNTMRTQRVYFGLEYGHMDDDIAHLSVSSATCSLKRNGRT
jgi:hypothetical protein